MKLSFCTVTTESHLPTTLALHQSLDQDADYQLFVFVTDAILDQSDFPDNFILVEEASLEKQLHFLTIKKKYRKKSDQFRWSLKPVLMKSILENKATDSVIYLDNDLYFYNNYSFLFDYLEKDRFLLCPHWRIKDPQVSEPWFLVNFKDGVYNAGFAAANQNAIEILDYWANACAWKCEQNPKKGLWDDQKYLDLIPAQFEGVKILQHRGCNVAWWNQVENRRTEVDGQVLINDAFPIVFIHFTKELIKSIESGEDKLLKPHLSQYKQSISKFK